MNCTLTVRKINARMENRNYRCNYCKKEYIPKRRRVQKFCSSSCRVGFFKLQKKSSMNNSELSSLRKKPKKQTVEDMSIEGVGNAALGTLAVNTITSIFTKEENKPATKGDLQKLSLKLNRYQDIRNLSNNELGKKPFYDTELNILVYL